MRSLCIRILRLLGPPIVGDSVGDLFMHEICCGDKVCHKPQKSGTMDDKNPLKMKVSVLVLCMQCIYSA